MLTSHLFLEVHLVGPCNGVPHGVEGAIVCLPLIDCRPLDPSITFVNNHLAIDETVDGGHNPIATVIGYEAEGLRRSGFTAIAQGLASLRAASAKQPLMACPAKTST